MTRSKIGLVLGGKMKASGGSFEETRGLGEFEAGVEVDGVKGLVVFLGSSGSC